MSVRQYVVGLAVAGIVATGGPDARLDDSLHASQHKLSRVVEIGRLEAWTTAVDRHQPGIADEWAQQVQAWPFKDVDHIIKAVLPGVVLGILQQSVPDVVHLDLRTFRTNGTVTPYEFAHSDTDAIQRVINRALVRGDANRFLKRAALLHTDIVMHGAGEEPAGSRSDIPTYTQRFADGRQTTSARSPTHWQAAREILALVAHPDSTRRKTLILAPEDDADVRAWYIAASAYLTSRDVFYTQHIESGLSLFPNDADLLMLSGAAHARLATPELQRVVRGTELTRGLDPAIGSTREELGRAESLLRRSLNANSGHAEARLRLGRVLALRGNTKQALAELQSASRATDDRLLLYYAHLCLGDTADVAGDTSLAKSSYEQARDLYPAAQAPRLALSQLAMRTGGHPAAANVLATLLTRAHASDDDTDPWWHFHASAGRNAGELMQRWYEAVQ